uniref:RING-type domain-containing protein n=1 Tax=Leptobrachium leishanense TaxID=445787 RepID=A0A8C5LQ34_9ANUR
MQEPREEEELGRQSPRGPHERKDAEDVLSSRGLQDNSVEREISTGSGPQLPRPNPGSPGPACAQNNRDPELIDASQGLTCGSDPLKTSACPKYTGITAGEAEPHPHGPSHGHPDHNIQHCLWSTCLTNGIQSHPDLKTLAPDQCPPEPAHDVLGLQEPVESLGPPAACVQLCSLEHPLRLGFPDHLQEQVHITESPVPMANLQNPLSVLAPSQTGTAASLKAPAPHRPQSDESCVQFGQEEPPEEEFPLLVDAFSVLGLQEDQDDCVLEEPLSGSPSPDPEDLYGEIPVEQLLGPGVRRRGVNMTEGVPVPSSEHVAEIVGRQGCKIKALRAKTNTYIKTPVRGEDPIFIVTGRKEDVEMAKREILAAADHFSIIRASRNKNNLIAGTSQGPPNLPGQTTIQVRVPYRVVGLVVGPKGATIKRIQQSTHTYIVTPSRDKEPVFEVTGMPENVDRAREEIEAHITMRTGSLIDFHPDNDFHSNGTDVCIDLLGGGSAGLWAKVHAPRRGSATSRNETLGSPSSESSYYGATVREQDPTSSFRPILRGSFSLEPQNIPPTIGPDDCDFGFEFLSVDLNTPTAIWSPYETSSGQLQNLSGCSGQRRNSGLSGSATPRISPTLPESGIGLEHPLARRIHSDPVSGISWLQTQGSLSSFSSSTGYSSSSSLPGSSSVASGSPTDSNSSDGQRKSGRDCIVCYESEVIAALVPCGHNLFCMECAIRICERAMPECPACHAPATQAIRIFS